MTLAGFPGEELDVSEARLKYIMGFKIDETWQVVCFPFEQNFLFQSPKCFEKSSQLVLGNLPIRTVLLMGGKNQPCKMKLLKRPKNSTKQ